MFSQLVNLNSFSSYIYKVKYHQNPSAHTKNYNDQQQCTIIDWRSRCPIKNPVNLLARTWGGAKDHKNEDSRRVNVPQHATKCEFSASVIYFFKDPCESCDWGPMWRVHVRKARTWRQHEARSNESKWKVRRKEGPTALVTRATGESG